MGDRGFALVSDESPQARASRTVDCAGELLLLWGYKRVTVEEIARRAGIGKGTIYLHWKTKDELFGAVLLREAISVLRDVIVAMRVEPNEVRLSTFARRQLLRVLAKPLYRAFYTRDQEILGRLTHSSCGPLQQYHGAIREVYERYFGILHGEGLVRADCDCPLVMSAMDALASGLVMQSTVGVVRVPAEIARRAGDVLAQTIERAFEPRVAVEEEAVVRAATDSVRLFESFLAEQRRALPDGLHVPVDRMIPVPRRWA